MKILIIILLSNILLIGCACQHREIVTPIPKFAPNNQYCKRCNFRVKQTGWEIPKDIVTWKNWWWK